MESFLRNLSWIEELLPLHLIPAPKHGGIGYFDDMKLVMILVEHPERTYEHKGVTYPFDIWKGVIFPIEYKKQSAFFRKYVFLENHPANKNWLFIPMESENFEDEVKQMLREVSKRNSLLGIQPKSGGLKLETLIEKPARKGPLKKIKADKKRENNFILSMVGKNKNGK